MNIQKKKKLFTFQIKWPCCSINDFCFFFFRNKKKIDHSGWQSMMMMMGLVGDDYVGTFNTLPPPPLVEKKEKPSSHTLIYMISHWFSSCCCSWALFCFKNTETNSSSWINTQWERQWTNLKWFLNKITNQTENCWLDQPKSISLYLSLYVILSTTEKPHKLKLFK